MMHSQFITEFLLYANETNKTKLYSIFPPETQTSTSSSKSREADPLRVHFRDVVVEVGFTPHGEVIPRHLHQRDVVVGVHTL